MQPVRMQGSYSTCSTKVNVVCPLNGYGYWRTRATGMGVLRLWMRAYYGYGYEHAKTVRTGVAGLSVTTYVWNRQWVKSSCLNCECINYILITYSYYMHVTHGP